MAFRRHLDAQSVPFDTLGATPFTDPDRYDISLGGRRCDLKSFLIQKREKISEVRKSPGSLLEAHALVPCDQFSSNHLDDQDLYIFAFMTGLVTGYSSEISLALEAGQPIYLMCPLPDGWARPRQWQSQAPLALKLEAGSPVEVEVGGQVASREFFTEKVILQPGQRTRLQIDFHSIAYLHIDQIPAGRLGLSGAHQAELLLIDPHEWGNIWVYGMDIFLMGYLTHEAFRQSSQHLPAGSRVWQYAQTKTDNRALPMDDLACLGDLFARARAWGVRKAHP